MIRRALISQCERYRYWLHRQWSPEPQPNAKPVLWVMLNPSTADASIDDPTIRRCVGFTESWGFTALYVVNLYAYRSTDPDALLTMPADIARGPLNHEYIASVAEKCSRVVCAWGAFGKHLPETMIQLAGMTDLQCLGTTKSGAPRHPLYVRGSTPLQEFNL